MTIDDERGRYAAKRDRLARLTRLVSILHPATVPGSGERKWGLSSGGYFHLLDNARTLDNLGMSLWQTP